MTAEIKDPDNGMMMFFNKNDYKDYKEMSNAKLYSDVCSKDKKISKAPVHNEIEK